MSVWRQLFPWNPSIQSKLIVLIPVLLLFLNLFRESAGVCQAFQIQPVRIRNIHSFALAASTEATTTTTANENTQRSATTTNMKPTTTSPPILPPISKTAKRIFFVRHGEVINPGGERSVYYGAMDVPLSPLGEKEAVAAAEYLSQFELSRIYSSPLSRAVFGAERIAELQKTSDRPTIQQLQGFTELDRGDWCGKTKEEIGADLMARFDACDESVTPKNGESFPALKRRVLQARDIVLSELEPAQSAVVVCHLQVTRSIVSDALGIPTAEMTKLPIATASITCIDYETEDGEDGPTLGATVHFQSFKPQVGLAEAKDGAN